MTYKAIVQYLDSKKYNNDQECLSFYNDFKRGGILLDRFLSSYSSHIITIDNNSLDNTDLKLLEELKCKANHLIKSKNFTSSLLATAFQADTNFYYKFSENSDYKNLIIDNYQSWLFKANVLSESMPNRGDLLLPFLSYAVNNNKGPDALNICKKNIKRIESFCYLIRANHILTSDNLDESRLKNSIKLLKKSIENGLFNELVYGFWFQQCNIRKKFFAIMETWSALIT